MLLLTKWDSFIFFVFPLLYTKCCLSQAPITGYHFSRALQQPRKRSILNTGMCWFGRRKWGHIKGQQFAKVSSQKDQQLVEELGLLDSSLWYWPSSNDLSRLQDYSQSTGRALTVLVCFGNLRNTQRSTKEAWEPLLSWLCSLRTTMDGMEQASNKWWSDRCSPKQTLKMNSLKLYNELFL